MTTRNTRKAAITPAASVAGFTAEQHAALRQGVAAALAAGKAAVAASVAQGSATDRLIAAFACPALLAHRFEFQARDKQGNVTETKLASLYEYARKAAPFYIAGKQQKARLSGFKAAVLAYAGVNDTASPAADKAWSLIKGFALPAAIALADNGIAATMNGNKLALSGGNGTTVAKGLVDAATKSTAALVRKVNAKGTNSDSNAKGKAKGKEQAKPELVPASPTDILRAATAYLKKVAAGDEAITNQRIAMLKAIARDCAAILKAETTAKA